jgi:hypothetical protein
MRIVNAKQQACAHSKCSTCNALPSSHTAHTPLLLLLHTPLLRSTVVRRGGAAAARRMATAAAAAAPPPPPAVPPPSWPVPLTPPPGEVAHAAERARAVACKAREAALGATGAPTVLYEDAWLVRMRAAQA